MNQDVSKSKRSPEFYFDACNVRIQATDSGTTGSIVNDKGNTLVYQLGADHTIIGHAVLKNFLVLFSTNGVEPDRIIRLDLDNNYDAFVLFSGDLNFSVNNMIDTEAYYESDDVQKVYWVDGINQLRHINIIAESTYTQMDATLFDAVPEVAFSAPYVSSIDFGGIHTSGMIQYAYNLIKQNGSQSSISPISELYPLNKNVGGGQVNEVVSKILNISIDSVDSRYDILRLYAIKYTSFNEAPAISLIAEQSVKDTNAFRYQDDGRIIRAITAEQFLFLGGTAFIPSTITSKYNRLILGNIKEMYFDVPTFDPDTELYYDTRAYRFPYNSSTSMIWSNNDINTQEAILHDGEKVVLTASNQLVPADHDCQNTFFDGLAADYKHKKGSGAIGATGTNIEVEIVQKSVTNPRNVLKSNEIYRLGIEFYNNRGQVSPPKWICDLKIPRGNLNGNNINTLSVTLTNEDKLIALGVVGWRVLRVEREDVDKTILCQGIVNPSIYQKYNNTYEEDLTVAKGIEFSDDGATKLPSPFMRNNTDLIDANVTLSGYTNAPKINKILHGNPICLPVMGGPSHLGIPEWPYPEIFRNAGSEVNHNSYEDTKLFQMYSPEITFLNQSFGDFLTYKVVAAVTNSLSNCGEWCKQIATENKDDILVGDTLNNLRVNGVISLFRTAQLDIDTAGGSEPNQIGILGPAGGTTKRIGQYQYYRKYINDPSFSIVQTIFGDEYSFSISGSPSIVNKGVSSKSYDSDTITNIDGKYKFSNHLFTIVTDKNQYDHIKEPIISINSIGAACLTIVDSAEAPLETILTTGGVTTPNSTGIIEISRVLTNQYGGSTYESRGRNSYLRIGRYQPIDLLSNQIDSAGDTFIGQYRFQRIMPNTTQVMSNKYLSLCEIVEFPVETSIDLANRSDYSVDGWDSYFQSTYDEYHNYNRVYSQQPIFSRTTATPFTFQERKVFDNRINATKVKTAGETVDSWTDILVNEEMYVDGKYGQITKIIQNNDIVYCIQEQAVAMLEIQPRVQTVATNGTSIELGRGAVLYNYKYLNTNSGCVNSESVFNSQSSVYYIDIVNKSINRIVGNEVVGLSDMHGLHSFMTNNLDYTTLKYSNAVTGCFDQVTNDAYFTTPGFTLSFNEQTNSFTSKYSFKPDRYIYTIYGMISVNLGHELWKHGVGNYCQYYGTTYQSYITLLAAPEPDMDCIFNNGEFKSEVSINGVDQPSVTIGAIRCWNEYQDTCSDINFVYSIPLFVGGNIKRKFRDWNLFIPRNYGTLQRMRGQWIYIKLMFDNTANMKLILHDFIVSYDMIQKI